MMNGLLWIGGPLFAAIAYFNIDNGGVRFGGAILVAIACFVAAVSGTEKRPTYGVDCRSYSIFASDC